MSQFGKDLKVYAQNGLRSAPAWLELGRQVESGSKPRANVSSRSQLVDLFSKDQTGLLSRAPAPQ